MNSLAQQRQQKDRDAEDLQKLGYVQELLRDMGGFSNFAVSFSVVSILTGATQLYGYGLNHGGPNSNVRWLVLGFFLHPCSCALDGGVGKRLSYSRRALPLVKLSRWTRARAQCLRNRAKILLVRASYRLSPSGRGTAEQNPKQKGAEAGDRPQ